MATVELVEMHAPVPATERGRGILISGDARSNSIVYCNGRSVFIRSLENPLQVDVYRDHAFPVTVARFSPNGEWVASGDASGTVRIWGRGAEHVLKAEIKAIAGRIDDLDWSFDGQRIVVSGDGKGKSFVRAFMWDTGNNIGEFDGHSKRALSCAFKPTRPFRIATCGEDYLVNFYEGPPFRFKTSHRNHSNFVNCVRYSPDGSKFLSVGSDKKGIMYNGLTGEKIGEFSTENGHNGTIYAASWSADGKQVLTVSADKTAKIWDVSEDGCVKVSTTFKFASSEGGIEDMQVGCLWLKDFLVSISLGGTISYLVAAKPESPMRAISGHMKSITAVTVGNREQGELFSSSYDGVIIRWISGVGFADKLERKEAVHVKTIVAAGGDLITCGLDNKIRKSPLPGDRYGDAKIIVLKSQCKDMDASAESSDLIVAVTDEGVILMRDSRIVSTSALGYTATAASVSPDGSEVIVGSQDGKLYVYSVAGDSLTQEAVLEKHRGSVTVVRFSPDGSMFASGDSNREAIVWDRITREVKVKNMLYHTAKIICLAWSTDSLKVATGSVDTSILVYDVRKPASSRVTIKGAHLGGITGVCFKDAVTLVSGGEDACVRVWKLP